MRLFLITSLLLSVVVSGFAPTTTTTCPLFGTTTTPSSKTRLCISSWGSSGPPHRTAQAEKRLENPETHIQSYLSEPDYVYARDTLEGGACLVSGLVKSTDRTDQTVFDMLNYELSAFQFSKIVAFCNDVSFAKKRLLSRSARYTGLLDKLDFVQATEADALPTLEQLEGVTNWVAYVDSDWVETTQQIAELAKKSSDLKNLAVLLVNAHSEGLKDTKVRQDLVETLKDDSYDFNLVAVGELQDHPEGQEYYQLREFASDEGALPEDAVFSREEALRMVTDTLQLHSGINKAFTVSEVYKSNTTEAKLIKGLREAGYARAQETDHMVRDGPANYEKAIDDWKNGNPNARGSGNFNNWWEAPEFQEAAKEQEEALKAQDEASDAENEHKEEIEAIATEWAKREYFRQSMAKTIDPKQVSEEDFVKDNWDRAMFEGDLKFRQGRGETPDAELELADFKLLQEKKKQTMLKRAKEELKEIIDEDDDDDDEGDDE